MLKRLTAMFRPLESILVILLLIAASYTYSIKHQADLVDKKISKIYRTINQEKEKIDLLEADWSLLNQVRRLETLVERYNGQLNLQPLGAEQIISLAQLPPKREAHTPALDDIDRAGIDQLTTGAVTIADDGPIIDNLPGVEDGPIEADAEDFTMPFDDSGVVESDFSQELGTN